MKRFEYRWITTKGKSTWPNIALNEQLNDCGKDGWECISIIVDAKDGSLTAFLKKELEIVEEENKSVVDYDSV